MTLVRYACPQCNRDFQPAEEVSSGAYARCPDCGGLAVPQSSSQASVAAFPELAMGGAASWGGPDDSIMGGSDDAATRAFDAPAAALAEFASMQRTAAVASPDVDADTLSRSFDPNAPLMDDTASDAATRTYDASAVGGGGGLFASLMPQSVAPPAPLAASAALSPPQGEATDLLGLSLPPEAPTDPNSMAPMLEPAQQTFEQTPHAFEPGPETFDAAPQNHEQLPAATAPAGGLFASLLMSAPDIEVSGRRPAIQDGFRADAPAVLPLSSEGTLGPGDDAVGPTAELTLPANLPSPPPPAAGGQWDIANTAMIQGPADPSTEQRLPGNYDPSGQFLLDRETFNDEEFESLLGGSFNTSEMDLPPSSAPPGLPSPAVKPEMTDGWVVSDPGLPPPLKRPSMPPGAPSLPPPRMKASPMSAAELLAGLAPIPTVASLGSAPSFGDGVTALRVMGLLLAALLLGGVTGAALAPPPPAPPSTGTEGALVRLAEARKLLAGGRETEAVAVLQAALALDGRLAEAQRDLGVAYARQEKFEEAARAYEMYLEIAPRAPDAMEVEQSIKRFRAQK